MSEAKNSIPCLIQNNGNAIHTPGYIQPHGFLMVLKEPDLQIIQTSNNLDEHLGIASESLLNKNLDNLLDSKQIDKINRILEADNFLSEPFFNLKFIREKPT